MISFYLFLVWRDNHHPPTVIHQLFFPSTHNAILESSWFDPRTIFCLFIPLLIKRSFIT